MIFQPKSVLFAIQYSSDKLCQLLYLEIRGIGLIRRYLSFEATKTLVSSLVLSRLDCFSTLLAGSKLQRVINCLARLICTVPKSAHITPLLYGLHWLPISSRIQDKAAFICFHIVSAPV